MNDTSNKKNMSGWAIAGIIIAVIASIAALLYVVLNRQSNTLVTEPPYTPESPAPDDKEKAIGQPCYLGDGTAGTYIFNTTTEKYTCKRLSIGSPCLLSNTNAGAGISGVYTQNSNGLKCIEVGASCRTSSVSNGRINKYGNCVAGNTGIMPVFYTNTLNQR